LVWNNSGDADNTSERKNKEDYHPSCSSISTPVRPSRLFISRTLRPLLRTNTDDMQSRALFIENQVPGNTSSPDIQLGDGKVVLSQNPQNFISIDLALCRQCQINQSGIPTGNLYALKPFFCCPAIPFSVLRRRTVSGELGQEYPGPLIVFIVTPIEKMHPCLSQAHTTQRSED